MAHAFRLTPAEQHRMRAAGRAASQTLAFIKSRLRAGVSTGDIDRWVRAHTEQLGGRPSQLGYHGFPSAVCTSRNEVVCHGVPRDDEWLTTGDIINVDVTTELNGYHGDTSATFFIGPPSPEVRHLVEVSRQALYVGILQVRAGTYLGDIGAAIDEWVRSRGCAVVTDWGGHGIGRSMHLPPHVAHTGVRGEGERLVAGMAFTIEPMITLGRPEVRTLSDGWSVVTRDGRWSAQFEQTVLVTRHGCEVLTPFLFEEDAQAAVQLE